MPICHYFLKGKCLFGNRCRNDHIVLDNVNKEIWDQICAIAVDICFSEKGGQWPLSCCGPYFGCNTYGGLRDTSPDEIRWLYYQASTSGQIEAFMTYYKKILQEAARGRRFLKEPSFKNIAQIVNLTPTNYNENSGVLPNTNTDIFQNLIVSPHSNNSMVTTADTRSLFTETESLTEKELLAFSSPKFTFGNIPTKPPPKIFC